MSATLPPGSAPPGAAACRCCGAPLTEVMADLGMTPIANSFIDPAAAAAMEPFYPLRALVCGDCRLVQLAQFETPQAIFSDYAYFSSYAESWVRHAADYVAMVMDRFRLGPETPVVEVASNDGYLLQHFVRRGVPVLGIDPAANVAAAALARGVPTEVAFFGAPTARRLRAEGHEPALIVANNVLAHVPDLHEFVEGFRVLLRPGGVLTLEFPHLLRLIEGMQLDTIYHEHLSYFSLTTAEMVLTQHGLTVFDVEELPTHGGSLRLYVRHVEDATKPVAARVPALRRREAEFGLNGTEVYRAFAAATVEVKCALLEFLIAARRAGKRVAGYGAPAKGNTLLNYGGVGPELLPFTVDLNPHKQGKLLPGTRIPVHPPQAIREERPDYVLILPWNLKDEIIRQLAAIRDWGGRFVVAVPTLLVL